MQNNIPVTDVTDELTQDDLIDKGLERLNQLVGVERMPFMFVGRSNPSEDVNAARMEVVIGTVHDEDVLAMALGIISVLGMNRLGPAIDNMMPELVQSMSLMAGMKELQDHIQRSARAHLGEPQTPAGDAGASSLN